MTQSSADIETPRVSAVASEITRIKMLFQISTGDKEDLISYATEVARLREQVKQPATPVEAATPSKSKFDETGLSKYLREIIGQETTPPLWIYVTKEQIPILETIADRLDWLESLYAPFITEHTPQPAIHDVAQPSRVTGASNQVEEAACLIWAELCPGMVMGDDDLPHYEAAAKAVLALTSTDGWTEQDLSEAKAEAKELSDYFNNWPGGCHDPDSCMRHLGCMYVQCKHSKKDGNELAKEIHAYAVSRPHRHTPGEK